MNRMNLQAVLLHRKLYLQKCWYCFLIELHLNLNSYNYKELSVCSPKKNATILKMMNDIMPILDSEFNSLIETFYKSNHM